jgi:hypothetical protein
LYTPEELKATTLFDAAGAEYEAQYMPPPFDDALFAVIVLFAMMGEE